MIKYCKNVAADLLFFATVGVMKVAILGFGASGLAVYCFLLEELNKLNSQEIHDLHIIEKSNELCAGNTYAQDLESSLIINMKACDMDVFNKEIISYYAWIDEMSKDDPSYIPYRNQENPPRKIFGRYLKHVQNCYQSKYSHGVNVRFFNKEALNVIKHEHNYQALFSDSSSEFYDAIFLCIGNPVPRDVYKLMSSPCYSNIPWGFHYPESLKNAQVVGVLGSGLTAIDTVLCLSTKCCAKKILMLSRHGNLPNTQGKKRPYQMKYLTKPVVDLLIQKGECRLGKIVELLNRELSFAYGKPVNVMTIMQRAKSSAAWLKNEIKASMNCVKPWQAILGNMENMVDDIWNAFDKFDKDDFIQNYYSIWMSYKHSTPLQNSFVLLQLMQSGRLQLHGGLQSVTFDEAAKQFSIVLRSGLTMKADWIINATGSSRNLTLSTSPLIKNMLHSGMIAINGYGGIRLDLNDMTILSSQNMRHENFYCIGQMSFGMLFYTNALDRNVLQAKQVVECFVENFTSAVYNF
jgi:uncharacterized NAD(P)/FAD-binding protein YdhS